MGSVAQSENGQTETPKILQLVAAPPGLRAHYLGRWVSSKTAGYEVRERWEERVDALVLAEWDGGERSVYPVAVTEEGISWHWDAYSITTEELDENDRLESRPVREPA